jgi:hypothetical protein
VVACLGAGTDHSRSSHTIVLFVAGSCRARRAGGSWELPEHIVYAKFVHLGADNAQGLVDPRRLFVLKYAFLIGAVTCCGSHSTNAMMPGDALSRLAFAEPARHQLVGWHFERRAISCNLRIPCPFSGRRFHASYRRQGYEELSASREPYRPCPASVAFPNGRLACLGLP